MVSESADTKAHAEWPRDRRGEAENPSWGCLLTADQDKSPQRFHFTDLQLDMKKKKKKRAQVTLDESEIENIDL